MLPKIVARPWQVPLFRIFYRFITLLQYETDYRSDTQIVSCYRIGTTKSGSKKPRPVILKFSAEYQRNIVFYNKKKLKGSKNNINKRFNKAQI